VSAPIDIVHDALERDGYGPLGRPFDFHSRCPGHGGDGRSLHVSAGGDQTVLLFCFSHGCSAEDIVTALGLDMRDLFGPGHRDGWRRTPRVPRRDELQGASGELAAVLDGLDAVGASWEAVITTDCRLCGAPHAMLVSRSGGRLSLVCAGDSYGDSLGFTEGLCTVERFTWALGYQVALERGDGRSDLDQLAELIRKRREERDDREGE
jgi:hypothetical protein